MDAFLLFTADGKNENDNTIPVTDIGKIIRYLGKPSKITLIYFKRA